mmetsp:Transcript_24000/g.46766  ORF Transcript_24000/g.46766 Transcript_24000/m.46766 type:complete len:331 (-) Transcript_24000:64-1056(-)
MKAAARRAACRTRATPRARLSHCELSPTALTRLHRAWPEPVRPRERLVPVGSWVGAPLGGGGHSLRRDGRPVGSWLRHSGRGGLTSPLAARDRRRGGRVPVGRSRRHLHRHVDGRLAPFLLLLDLGLNLLGVAVEEEVNHHVPRLVARDRAAQAEYLPRKEPVEQADRVLTLVVGGDGHVDVLKRRVGVAKSDGRDVGVSSLLDRLVVGARVGQQQQPRLHELVRDLVGEGTGGEAAGDGRRAGVLAVLEDGALAVWAGRDDANISRVLDRHNDARREEKLVVCPAEIDDVDAVRLALPHVASHLEIQVFGAQVRRAREHHLEVLLLLLI